jgi:hypothetical protein
MQGSTFHAGVAVRRLVLAAAASFALSMGCRGGGSAVGDAAPSSEPAKCTSIGQTCEFSPNKLGSCVLKDNCSQDCLVCQSQH